MPGLLRGVARTAVIAGTATSVSNRVSRRQANRWSQQERRAAATAAARLPGARAAAARSPRAADPIEQLKELGALHDAGDPHRRGVRGAEGQDPRLDL